MANVITSIREKRGSGFLEPTYLGAEQKFVKALRNSHNNNLEEQYLLGVDNITKTVKNADGSYTTTVDYYSGEVPAEGFYRLVDKRASVNSLDGAEYRFDGSALIMPFRNTESIVKQGSTLKLSDPEIFEYFQPQGSTSASLYIIPDNRVVELLELYFIKGETETLVSKKTIQVTYSSDGTTATMTSVVENFI